MKSLIKKKKFIIGIAAALTILVIIGSILLFNKGNKENETSITKNITNNYIAYIKINPSIKLEYTQTCKQVEKDSDDFNCDEPKVTNYELINDDAKNIYKGIDLLGSSKDLFKVLNLICETAKENGIVFEKVDIYTDWDKIENYIDDKKEISDTIKFNIEITNKDDVNKKVDAEENNITTYNVSFDTNGGNNIESQVVKKDDKAVKPSNPIRSGYKFIEWQLDNKSFDFDTKINKDITLKAKWEKEEKNNSTNNNTTNNDNTSNNKSDNSNNNTNTNTNNNTSNNSGNSQSSGENNNTQQPETPPKEEDTHKGVINLNDNVMYITGDIVYKCDNCISNSVIQKINSSKGITNRGLDASYAWISSLNIPEGKYSSYSGSNLGTKEDLLIKCGADMVGGASDWEPKLLTEQVCNEYKLTCDRW